MRSFELAEPPVGDGLRLQHRLGVLPEGIDRLAAGLSGDFFQQGEHGLDDLRLGLDFQPGGACRPGGVSAEEVLLGRRDVSFRPVGQLVVERGLEGTLSLDLQAGDAVDLAGHGHHAQVAHPYCLKLQLPDRVFVEIDLLPRVDLGPVLRLLALHLVDQPSGPGQSGLVGRATLERERGFCHRQWHPVVVLDCLVGPVGDFGDLLCVLVDISRLGRLAVVHPMQIAAGTLRHDADEGRVEVFGPHLLPHPLAEPAVVVGRDGPGAVVVHRVVGQ